MSKRRWVPIVAVWVLLMPACGRQAPPPPKSPTVVVAKPAARRLVVASVTPTGTVEPERTARLVSQVEGEVELLAVREADPVRSGQVLLRIDPSRLAAARDEARGDELAIQVDLDDARRVLERDQTLFERQGIGKERLEKSETTVRRLEAAVARSRARVAGLTAQLADTEVRAPFAGYVLDRSVELGDVVKSGSPLLSVASRGTHVLVHVSATDLSHLHLGDHATLAVDDTPSVLTARISRIRPQVDVATRTAAVEVAPTSEAALLLPGMLVRVTFTLARRENVVAVPADAILVRPDGSRMAFVVEGTTAAQRSVTTGLEGGDWLEILTGIEAGDLVVLQGQERLKDGAPVTIKGTGVKVKPQAAPGEPAASRVKSPTAEPSALKGTL